ncbi:unnamed protein product, partial [Vitis vinifera]
MASLVSSPFTLPTSKVDQLSSFSQKHYFLHSFLPKKTNQANSKSCLRVKCAAIGNGLFTQTTPEVRRIVPDNDHGLPTVKVVYVVLEAQYQSALTAADANIFIGSLIFVEELALKVKAAVEKERDRLDAVLVFPSMPEVMRLNKLGSFSMSQLGQSKSPFFQLFKKKKSSAGFADSMLKLVRTLPKVLKYLPSDKAQDARLYILSLQFWLGGSPDNLMNFLKMISGSYVPALKRTKIEYSDPVLFLDSGIWHPLAPCMYDDLKGPNAPVIGLVLQRSHIVTGDESHYVAVIMELEARGAKVIPIFAGGLDFSGPVERFLIDPVTKRPFVNSVVSLTGFALVGGPARQDHPRAVEALMKLDVPYIVALPLVFQTTEEWLNSTLGLHPIQVALQVALPELDGGMEPIVFAGRDPRTGKAFSGMVYSCLVKCNVNAGKSHALHKRVEQLCIRAIRWAELKRKSKAEKKLAITVFSFPPDKGNVGTAAYLNVFDSIFSVLKELKRDGYNVEGLPETSESLIEDVLHDKEAKFSSPNLNIAYKMGVREYQTLTPYATALEESWGKPPGNLNSDGENLLVGMSDVCYPDSLIGNIPNVYYYAANNPSEATIAKRRSYANTISYLTPPAENAGLYKGLKQLSELISSTAKQCNLDKDVYSKIMEIESRLLPCGLHVIGEPPSAMEAVATLDVELLRQITDTSRGALTSCLKLVVADNELRSLKQALEGKYVEPGPGGDPIRNPKVLPTGKNIHALDPQSIPTAAALQSAMVVVDRLLERQKADNGGKYPETVALVLWGTDNIKTYGESLAQVLWMIGVRPVADTFGRVNRVEPVSLEELGRPRIDVVVNCSGVFRDLFINQMNLLDRAVKMVAELDEPADQNYVRKHALEQAQALGIEVRDAATRVFSNASGSYSSNINLAVENSSWNDEKQLQDMYLSRKSFAFDCDAPGAGMTEKRKVFEMALSTADATFQNLDSSEISLTDVSHYFDSDPTNLVQGLRKDGKKPNAYIADTTTANAQVRTLSETVRLDARTKLLNPKWYEGMMSSGYEGVREIEKRLTNTVGWSATSGQVDNWVYEEANSTFIQDEEMLKRLMNTNPNSFRKLVQTFLEANGRGYWETSEDNIEKLRQLYSEVEDKIEGIDRNNHQCTLNLFLILFNASKLGLRKLDPWLLVDASKLENLRERKLKRKIKIIKTFLYITLNSFNLF